MEILGRATDTQWVYLYAALAVTVTIGFLYSLDKIATWLLDRRRHRRANKQ